VSLDFRRIDKVLHQTIIASLEDPLASALLLALLSDLLDIFAHLSAHAEVQGSLEALEVRQMAI